MICMDNLFTGTKSTLRVFDEPNFELVVQDNIKD